MNYQKAEQLFQTARNKETGKPIANNTRLMKRQSDLQRYGSNAESYAIKLHDTDVVTFHPDGSITLNTGGWQTVTTKDRMNAHLPREFGNVRQKQGIWYYCLDGKDFIYSDTIMELDKNGKPLSDAPDQKEFEKKKRKIDRLCRKYVNDYLDHIRENGLDDPSGGDCWPCYFATQQLAPPLDRGAECLGFNHYLQHFQEKYYPPSLLWRAIVEQNFRDPALIWDSIKRNCKHNSPDYIAKNALRRFFMRRKIALVKEIDIQRQRQRDLLGIR